MFWDVVVIGAGAAGLLAGIHAAESGRRVLILEKNKKPGVKILMSGGTRCNLTHDTDRQGIVAAFGKPGQFLHAPLALLGPRELIHLVESEGVRTKVEATGKVFPVSNKATDVLAALLRRLERSGAQLVTNEGLVDWVFASETWTLRTTQREVLARDVVLTTGGKSYPGCGTIGDGYRLAAKLGHTIVTPRPALVPITLADSWAQELTGVTLSDVGVALTDSKGEIRDQRRGSFLFTHFGCSGPAVLDVSRAITAEPDPASLVLNCDWTPGVSNQELLDELQDLASTGGNRTLGAWLSDRVPQRLAERLARLSGISSGQHLATLGKVQRLRIVLLLRGTPLRVTGTLGFAKAEVTAGGIALGEVDSRNMRSRVQPRLLVAGEVLDLDGPIGGFNFQAAFSTGWLAGALK